MATRSTGSAMVMVVVTLLTTALASAATHHHPLCEVLERCPPWDSPAEYRCRRLDGRSHESNWTRCAVEGEFGVFDCVRGHAGELGVKEGDLRSVHCGNYFATCDEAVDASFTCSVIPGHLAGEHREGSSLTDEIYGIIPDGSVTSGVSGPVGFEAEEQALDRTVSALPAEGGRRLLRREEGAQPEGSRGLQDNHRDLFVKGADATCDGYWSSWVEVHERGVSEMNVIVMVLFPQVGNLFVVLRTLISLARYLKVGLVLVSHTFRGFRLTFDPSYIAWEVDYDKLRELSGVGEKGFQVLKFNDGIMTLTEEQLGKLAKLMNMPGAPISQIRKASKSFGFGRLRDLLLSMHRRLATATPPLKPCTWNMLLRRSEGMMSAMERYRPFRGHPDAYGAWHIRTAKGETSLSYHANENTYVVEEPSAVVCPAFSRGTAEALRELGLPEELPIFIATNSMEMGHNCSVDVGGSREVALVDVGVEANEVHTAFTQHPEKTAMSAFLDFLFVMDADFVVRTGSSFSGSVVDIKGLTCTELENLGDTPLLVCMAKSS